MEYGSHSGVIREPIPPRMLGSAQVTPAGDFEAGSYATFTLVYTAGVYGIDDTGSLRICFRFASDQGPLQFDQPGAPNHTTIEASNGAVLQYRFDPKGNVRPWDRTLYIKVVQGYLSEGDTITVRFGDTKQGSPGLRLQTFVEDRFEFRTLVDPIASFNYQPVPNQPWIRIVAGGPHVWRAVLPTSRRVGEPFRLSIKGEDRWGNPSDRCEGMLRLRPSQSVAGLPETVAIAPGDFAVTVDGLRVDSPGDVSIVVADADGERLTETNPLRIVTEAALLPFWGDLHAQSGETIGTNSADAYFRFARDRAFLDAASHQGNDFQITGAFWRDLNRLTESLNEPGRFVTLPGYEWSGNTALGGDRNVFFATEGRTIRRSSHALIEDQSDLSTDCTTAGELFEALIAAQEDAVCWAHVGGRYADINLFHDGRLERSVEVHSSWGTFEWIVHDAFEKGYRVGIVGNSDGHKGRPGAEYAGAGLFGAIGGLTCYRMPDLTRAALLECLRRRRHYATTGGRMLLDVTAAFDGEGTRYHDDPALGPAVGHPATEAMMGDIVQLPRGDLRLGVSVLASAPIERLDVFNGRDRIETIRPYRPDELGRRVRVVWEGATYRGRARQVIWDGSARFAGNHILEARPINFFNNDKTLERIGDDGLRWRSLTTGNMTGFEVWLQDGAAGTLEIDTPMVRTSIPVAEIGYEDRVFEAGGLDRRLRVFRLPSENPHRTLELDLPIALRQTGDNPLFVRLTQEDGHLAWSSPIYVFR